MKNYSPDYIRKACLSALSMGIITLRRSWDMDLAVAMHKAMTQRRKPLLPDVITADQVYDAMGSIVEDLITAASQEDDGSYDPADDAYGADATPYNGDLFGEPDDDHWGEAPAPKRMRS